MNGVATITLAFIAAFHPLLTSPNAGIAPECPATIRIAGALPRLICYQG
jgi:hypothetical protein